MKQSKFIIIIVALALSACGNKSEQEPAAVSVSPPLTEHKTTVTPDLPMSAPTGDKISEMALPASTTVTPIAPEKTSKPPKANDGVKDELLSHQKNPSVKHPLPITTGQPMPPPIKETTPEKAVLEPAVSKPISLTKAEIPVTVNNSKNSGAQSHEEGLALANKSGCLACHKIETKLVGPAWRDVSKRYKGDPDAKAHLIAKVKAGGKGNWTDVTGGIAMPPYSPRVSDENIEKLVTFVLSQ